MKRLLLVIGLAACNGQIAGEESDAGCPVCPVCAGERAASEALDAEVRPRDAVEECVTGTRLIPIACPPGAGTILCFEVAKYCVEDAGEE